MAFTKGNRYGRETQPFIDAVRRAIAQDDGKRLRAIAERLIDLAVEGEAWAVRELADRLDGKAKQSVEIAHTGDPRGLTLEELRAEVAAALAGTGRSDSSPDQSGAVH